MVQKNSFKYFIEYNDNDVIRLPQMTDYSKKINENATVSLRLIINN